MEARYQMKYLSKKGRAGSWNEHLMPMTLPKCMEIITGLLVDGWTLYHLTMRRVK